MNVKFSVQGMSCAACSARVEKVTNQIDGVERAEVNLLAGTMTAKVKDASAIDEIINAVSGAGYEAKLSGNNVVKKDKIEKKDNSIKVRIIASFAFLLVLMYFTMGHMVGLPVPGWYHGTENALVAAFLQLMLTLPVVFLNRSYYSRGLKALFNRAPNMDSLIAVGSGASLIYGIICLFIMADAQGSGDIATVAQYSKNLYFESAAMILTLITLGKFLEERAKGKTGDAIRRLMDLAPKTATVKRDALVEVAIEDVRVGDIVVVRSGGRIPVDGTVTAGHGAIDQSALTGESVPVDAEQGSKVSAATINLEGYLEIRADSVGEDTTLSQIIRMVEEAGGSKAPIARLADKIAGVFVPVVMLIATVAFVVWMIAGSNFAFALNMGISVLVISCPCALGLATPVAIMVGTGRGAGMGVLFKNAESLERLHNVDTVVLDKTGTLTLGRPVVTKILPSDISEDVLLSVAVAVEAKSEHPFAKAIVEKNGDNPIKTADDFQTLPGKGVCATVDGKKYYGGNRRLMEELNVSVPPLSEYKKQGMTPLYFATEDQRYLGAILAADVLKADSAEAVAQLQKMHLDVVMLSGDNKDTAESIAATAGIVHVISDVLPNDKANVILKLHNEGHHVLMVGDGINDAPALITADVGMSVGSGTDIAIESADVVLMQDSLLRVCDAVSLSKATMRNIKQNLFWAFFYNILGIPIAAGVLYPFFGIQLSPMIGAAAMSLSSVFVVTNALHLQLFKPKNKNANNDNDVKELDIEKENESMETVIKVDGMMCSHCKARVESVCKAVEGVSDAVVDLQEKQVTVTGNASLDALKKAISDAGYEVIG